MAHANGGIETERDCRGRQIVVNGLWHTDYGDAVLVHLLRDGQRAVTAHDGQRGNSELFHAAFGSIEQFPGKPAGFAVAGLGGETSAIGRAQNRAAAHQQAAKRFVIQRTKFLWCQQTFEAADDAEGFPPALGRRLGHGADDGVESGAIPTAGDNRDFHLAR